MLQSAQGIRIFSVQFLVRMIANTILWVIIGGGVFHAQDFNK